MGSRVKIAEILTPMRDALAEKLHGRESRDPLVLVQDRLVRLIDRLEDPQAPLAKMEALQELGFFREHKLSDEFTSFQTTVNEAITETMAPGWD